MISFNPIELKGFHVGQWDKKTKKQINKVIKKLNDWLKDKPRPSDNRRLI